MQVTDPSQIFVAKAQRVIDASLRRQAVPRTRTQILDCAAVIRRRIADNTDPTLTALGLSLAGIAYHFEREYGLAAGDAEILAAAAVELIHTIRKH